MIKALQNKIIGVIAGGWSLERSVSLRSGKNVYSALVNMGYDSILIDPKKRDLSDYDIDFAFIALHGQYGEDGAIQSYLEKRGIPYTGSGITASSIAMNKIITKELLIRHNIPTPNFSYLENIDLTNLDLSFPIMFKPISEGSSIGIEKIQDLTSLEIFLKKYRQNKQKYFLEEFIPGKEVTVGLLDIDNKPFALPLLELRPNNNFYDYKAKYTKGLTEFILPAEIPESQTKLCQNYAMKLHSILGCRSFSRVDMIISPTMGPFVLEINTIPGLTELSDIPAQAKHAGISFPDLIELILKSIL